jgi:hypothetical protein
VWHLAYAGDRPTICVVQSVTDIAFFYTARIGADDRFQAIGTAMFFDKRQLDLRPAHAWISDPLRAGWLPRHQFQSSAN